MADATTPRKPTNLGFQFVNPRSPHASAACTHPCSVTQGEHFPIYCTTMLASQVAAHNRPQFLGEDLLSGVHTTSFCVRDSKGELQASSKASSTVHCSWFGCPVCREAGSETCTRPWKRTRECELISEMALAWRACQASSLSSFLLMLFSWTSSQLSLITVHREPPAQPYRDAFWNLPTMVETNQQAFEDLHN